MEYNTVFKLVYDACIRSKCNFNVDVVGVVDTIANNARSYDEILVQLDNHGLSNIKPFLRQSKRFYESKNR
jgi:hypothetical protein